MSIENNFSLNLSGLPNPTSSCFKPDEVMPWCRQQHFVHYYIYIPLLTTSFVFLMIEGLLYWLNQDEKILFNVKGKDFKVGNLRRMMIRGSRFLIGAFLVIYLAQNWLSPFNYLPDSWKNPILNFLGFGG